MAQTSVNFRMDAELKESVEEICRKMGMSLTTAITIWSRINNEHRLVYVVEKDAVVIISCKGHYNK